MGSERRDEVDDVVRAWAHERPDLDPTPLHVFSRITRLARHLEIARRAAFTRQALERGEFDVLSALRRSGAPYELTPGRLIAETLVSSGTMTNRIDRLAGKGLVAREADTSDRRVVRVRLTPTGKQAVDAALSELLQVESDFLRTLPAGDRDELVAHLRTLLLHFRQP